MDCSVACSSRGRQQRPEQVTPKRNFCESARARAGDGASGGMRANDCLTEVERRPSAEHAGCGATVPRSDAHKAGGRMQSGRSLWCAGTGSSEP